MRTLHLLAAVVLFTPACTMPKAVGESDTTGEGTSDDPTATGSASEQSASAESGDTAGDTGIVPMGLYVDCADLGPGEPTVGPGDPGPLGFPIYACNPRNSGAGEFTCCSSDPATGDGMLPAYQDKSIPGSQPLYSDAANDDGTWGMCVRTADIPAGLGLASIKAMNCPIPCNPTWDLQDVETVCGTGRSCCQTIELGPQDCVFDEVAELWRPAAGEDIGVLSYWGSAAHDTHQDPNGTVCLEYADGEEGSEEFAVCVRELSVADQRGFCIGLGPDQSCPDALSSYIDVCEAMNS
jgi:hypothetical protein